MKTAEHLLELTAEDVMTREPVTVPRRVPVRDAARMLRRAGAGAAAVVDEQGRCVGVLSTGDVLRWVEDGCPEATAGPVRTCSFQTEGQVNGEQAVICTLAPGSCPLQSMRPGTGGRHVAVCLQPTGVLCDWQQVVEGPPEGGVACRYMAAEIVSVAPGTPLAVLARVMVDSRLPRLLVLDGRGRPVGVVSSTDVLAALASEWQHPGTKENPDEQLS